MRPYYEDFAVRLTIGPSDYTSVLIFFFLVDAYVTKTQAAKISISL